MQKKEYEKYYFDFALALINKLSILLISLYDGWADLRITLDYQYLKMMLSKSKGYSMIPVVGARARKISCSVGK